MRHERTVETTAPPQLVWEIWSDPATWPQWNPDVRAISLNGPFATGTTGEMTTGQGTHAIQLDRVVPEQGFDLVTSPIPATTFRFHCQIDPVSGGSRVSQSVSMSGLLAPIMSPLAGNRIAAGFEPILSGLAKAAEDAAGR
jgi:uncharacterized protein YndB with AHSA1/START domain